MNCIAAAHCLTGAREWMWVAWQGGRGSVKLWSIWDMTRGIKGCVRLVASGRGLILCVSFDEVWTCSILVFKTSFQDIVATR